MSLTKLSQNLGISNKSLELRREFLEISKTDAELLCKLQPWAENYSKIIAKEFYDHQFHFGPTFDFFSKMAAEKSIAIDELRAHLEAAQAGYYFQIFKFAATSWDVEYFEKRLHVGEIHNRINLPLKWYVGSYARFMMLTKKYLPESQLSVDEQNQAEICINKIFLYDIQAIVESFFAGTLESVGFSFDGVSFSDTLDKLDFVAEIKANVATLLEQCQALATGTLSDKSLNTKLAGKLGEAFQLIASNLRSSVGSISTNANQLDSMATSLNSNSNEVYKISEQVTQQATDANESIDTMTSDINSISVAAEEISASIHEISSSIQTVTSVAAEASELTKNSRNLVQQLTSSSMEIDKVVKVITNIAEQTNLLALNATIESSRAGEAGKGFTVVANEVKTLAKDTALATSEISDRVAAIQQSSAQVADAIEKITEVIATINESQLTISAAMEEQTLTVNEIAKSIGNTSKASSKVSEKIDSVTSAIKTSTAAIKQTSELAEQLSTLSSQLKDATGRFDLGGMNVENLETRRIA